MTEIIIAVFAQIEKLLPERFRVRIISCTAFMGLLAFMFYSAAHFATKTDMDAVGTKLHAQITASVAPLAARIKQDRLVQDDRFLAQLSNEIVDVSAKCSESHNQETRDLYRRELAQALTQWRDTKGSPYDEPVDCGELAR